jgi:CheY-like chemotaxis protein
MPDCAEFDDRTKTMAGNEPPAAGNGRDAKAPAQPAPQPYFAMSEFGDMQPSVLRASADSQKMEGQSLLAAVAPTAEAKLRVLASMMAEVRTELHAILGGTQLLQLNSSLDPAQCEQVDTIKSAGMKLLRKINQAVNIADEDADLDDRRTSVATLRDDAVPSRSGASSGVEEPPAAAVPDRVLRILVVDDIETNREIASTFVRAAGHLVETAVGGAEAVTAAATGDFDVILMDVRMPNVDGLQASRLIRTLPGVRGRVPIVALTAQTGADQVQACREMGMNGYLAKPFRYDTLVEALHRSYSEMPIRRAPKAGDAVPAPVAVRSLQEGGQASASASAHAGGREGYDFTRAYCHYVQSDAASREAVFDPSAYGAETNAKHEGIDAKSTWIEVASPWEDGQHEGRQELSLIMETQFKLSLTAVGPEGNRTLADKRLTCEPPRDGDQYEFHWLLYVEPHTDERRTFRSTCDLWRWSGSSWCSITAGGARFTPDEIYGFGWRYCGPCVERSAWVDVA